MKKIHSFIVLFVILTISLLIRLWNLTTSGLWHDEAFSALLIQMPFSEMMHRIALDVHPPLYYWLLNLWSDFFGLSLGALRGFSVFFGVLSVLMVYKLIKDISGKTAYGLAAAALLSINPFHIQYSFEARMYTLGTFFVILGCWLILHAVRTNKWKWWLGVAITTTAGALTHYFVLFSLIAQAIFIFFWWLWQVRLSSQKKLFLSKLQNWRWLISYGLSIILYSWWLPDFWKQFSQVQENYWIPEMTRWSIPQTIWKILLGGFRNETHTILLISIGVLALLILIYLFRFGKKYKNWMLLFMAILPFVLAVLVSLQTSLFLDRYFIFASVFITSTVAMSIYAPRFKSLSVSLIILIMIVSTYSYVNAWQKLDVAHHPGMTAAAAYLQDKKHSQDKIIVASTSIYFSHRYYYNLENSSTAVQPVLYLPGIHEVNQLPHFSGTALLENKDFVGSIDDFAKPGDTVWLLWTTGFSSSKPDNIPASWEQTSESKFGDIFPHRGDIYVTRYEIK